MFRRIFHKPSGNNSEKRQMCQNSIRFKRIERCNPQKQIPNAKHRPSHRCSSNLRFRVEYTKWIILLFKKILKIRIYSNTIRPTSTKTLQFQHTRTESNRNIQIPKRYRNSEDEADNPEDQHSLLSPPDIQASGTADNNQLLQLNSDSDNSENVHLSKTQKNFTPTRKIHPSEIQFTPHTCTTRENHRRRSNHRLLTTHNHNRHTIKKNTVIRKKDLAVVTEKKHYQNHQLLNKNHV